MNEKYELAKITYVIPDVSGTNAPQPKNGGTDIQNV